ncbi:MAG TPA: DNA gyrase subunit A [Candidatus Faecenecus gallistercoris]|uniref:DNA gyrase subunit A n=1 Tax=Candidatus Faecenecus gallistercoris TaxID=2840793 RepID=A0A9D0YYM4_9FIRM|nr:DNA gyrase subunit A [Candidatus Faecenecus gallistercoris]
MEIQTDHKLVDVNISEKMRSSFLDYSMSVIVARALPDVRDGLKPVHRRILYTMFEDGLTPDKPFRKSATTVGAVLGSYHPHGDSSVYDAMVRMAQDFNYRCVLVDGHGNFESIDGFEAAAYRYTEARLSKISLELLRDINKNTVDFVDNFDGTTKEPSVLPSRFPNILVNGTMGIAVGMATNIPPHNLGETINACIAKIDNPDITLPELMEHIKGPDFPTGGYILGNSGIVKAYETGRGTIVIRAKASIEEKNNHQRIVVTEIPYGVNKSVLITKIADLVRNKVIEGISDLRDETDLNGIKIVIEIKREANANVVLNNLYKYSQLQSSFGINLLALDNGQPKVMTLNQILESYIDFQKSVIIRRTQFDLDKAKKRAHILEGLKICQDHIDEIVALIKASKSDEEAIKALEERFQLSEAQSQAILELKLRRLTGLEREKIEAELAELEQLIQELESILASEEKVKEILKQEMAEIRDKYNDERRTVIDMTAIDYIEDESLIPVEKSIITLTNNGYIKRMPVDTYRSQNRGGVGIKGMSTNENDFVSQLVSVSTHDSVLFFTNRGKVYRMKGYEVPAFSRQSKGLPIINLLPLEKEESVNSIIALNDETEDSDYLTFITKEGLVKRTNVLEFKKIRNSGKLAIILHDDDELVAVRKTKGNNEIVIGASNGRMVRFNENEVRSMGRGTSGVKGIDLDGAYVVGAEIIHDNAEILIVTEKGYGKRTNIDEYRLTHRGSKGVKALNVTEKNGAMIALKTVSGDEDLIIITDSGVLMRMSLEQVSTLKRATQGVRLINLKDNQKVATVALVEKAEETTEEEQNESEDKPVEEVE